jgi:outer membrane protein assembly factor BamD (BamD/ComL family)
MSEMKIVDRKGHSTRLKEEELLEKGKSAYQDNKYSAAIELFSQLLTRNPHNI